MSYSKKNEQPYGNKRLLSWSIVVWGQQMFGKSLWGKAKKKRGGKDLG